MFNFGCFLLKLLIYLPKTKTIFNLPKFKTSIMPMLSGFILPPLSTPSAAACTPTPRFHPQGSEKLLPTERQQYAPIDSLLCSVRESSKTTESTFRTENSLLFEDERLRCKVRYNFFYFCLNFCALGLSALM